MAQAKAVIENQQPPIAAGVMPPELREQGWRLVRDSKKALPYRAKNDKLGLYTDAHKDVDDAIAEARSLCEAASAIALLSDSDEATTSPGPRGLMPIINVLFLKDLRPSNTNARQIFDEVKLQELADSIKEKGVLEPLLVRERRRKSAAERVTYEIVAGERRFRAAKLAVLQSVPCIVKVLTDAEAEEVQVIENDQREDLTPLERAVGYQKLIERHGYTADQLAEKVGKSKAFVYGFLKLNNLPPVAREALTSGKIPISTAQLIARLPSEAARLDACKEIIDVDDKYYDDTMSFREAKDFIERQFMKELKGAPFDRVSERLLPAAGSCEACPKRTGNNRVEFPDGRADICTDPSCFAEKIAAHERQLAEKAAGKGHAIIAPSKSKGLFRSYDNKLRSDKYIDLSEKCSQDKQNRTFRQLLAGKLEPDQISVALDHNKKARLLVSRNVATTLLKSEHKITLPKKSAPHIAGGYDWKAEEEKRKKREAERKEKLKWFLPACDEAARQLVETTEALFPNQWHKDHACSVVITRRLIELYLRDNRCDDDLMRRRGFKNHKAVDQFISTAWMAQLSGFANELVFWSFYAEWEASFDKPGFLFMKECGIDFESIINEFKNRAL